MGRIHQGIAKNGVITNQALRYLAIPGPTYSNTNTVLLTGGTANVSDIGGNPVTVTGTVSTSTSEPFTSNLNSFTFNNNAANYISMVSNVFSPGTGDFTFECFVNFTTFASTYSVLLELGQKGSAGGRQNGFLFYVGTSGQISMFQNGIFQFATANSTITTGSWYHIALVRLDGVTKLYVDGVEKLSTIVLSGVNFNLGGALIATLADTTSAFNGNISNWRWVKGLAIYRGDFNKPTADLSVVANSFTWSQNYGVRTV